MGFFECLRRSFVRRRFRKHEGKEAAERLAESPLSAAAPEVAGAILDLRDTVTTSAYDAVQAAHESLAPVCKEEMQHARREFERQHAHQAERIAQLASRCRDEVERAHERQVEQTEQMRGLRELYAENQEQQQRWAESYDWQIVKEFCFRFIRILDTLDERLETLRDEANGDHVRDVQNNYRDIQFALEASGVEQFQPEARSQFAGNEKRLRAVGTVPAKEPEDHGLVAKVRKPGYRLSREGQEDRILRPAQVDVFALPENKTEPRLQRIQS